MLVLNSIAPNTTTNTTTVPCDGVAHIKDPPHLSSQVRNTNAVSRASPIVTNTSHASAALPLPQDYESPDQHPDPAKACQESAIVAVASQTQDPTVLALALPLMSHSVPPRVHPPVPRVFPHLLYQHRGGVPRTKAPLPTSGRALHVRIRLWRLVEVGRVAAGSLWPKVSKDGQNTGREAAALHDEEARLLPALRLPLRVPP